MHSVTCNDITHYDETGEHHARLLIIISQWNMYGSF